MSHPFSLAYALYFATRLHHLRRERQTAQEQAEALIAVAAQQGFAFWLAISMIHRGWALAELCPEPVEGQEQDQGCSVLAMIAR